VVVRGAVEVDAAEPRRIERTVLTGAGAAGASAGVRNQA
jgi:hypothetical protein